MTPYLSDEWFRLWKVALDEAEKLDMNVWIYDENSYPSGFAGGHVPEIMPESRGRGLAFRDEKQAPKIGPDTVAVYRVTSDALENVTEKLREGESMPEGRYVVASVVRATNSPWHGDRCYVDLMYPGVTEKFLEVTLDAYKKNIGDQFGKRVLGSFTDEPNVRPAGGLPWTDHLPAAFQKRWGYNLLDHLPSLIRPVGNWKQVRHDYFQVVLEQYIEHWAKPYYDWCEKNGIAFTGHYWDHEWPNCVGVTDNMAMSAWQHIPGIDCLMNQYREDTHAQFGNVRFVKEVQSLCNQLGRKRYLCEIYGAGGWDLRFEDMKRIADWLGVLGVNLFDEHLSYVTLRGARKADHPQSFSYHEPWWDSYHVVAEYITRLSAAMSMGEQRNHVLVIEPTTTAWMYQEDSTQAGQARRDRQDVLRSADGVRAGAGGIRHRLRGRHGPARRRAAPASTPSASAVASVVGKRAYHTVVLPPLTETLRSETMKLLEEFAAAGGQIVSCGPPPALVDGRPSDRGEKLAKSPGWQQVDAGPRYEIARARAGPGPLRDPPRRRRQGHSLPPAPATGRRRTAAAGQHQHRRAVAGRRRGRRPRACSSGISSPGSVSAYPFAWKTGLRSSPSSLPPCGSLLLFLANEASDPGKAAAAEKATSDRIERADADPPDCAQRAHARLCRHHCRRRDAQESLLLPRQPVGLAEERPAAQSVGQRRAVQR